MSDSPAPLGIMSISLAVKDLAKSKAFYEALGFAQLGGDVAQNWCILKNGDSVVGLFEGMFDKNMLTFNPGWDSSAQNLEGGWTDVRQLEAQLRSRGLEPTMSNTQQSEAGPAHLMLTDPDGNPILIDQHR